MAGFLSAYDGVKRITINHPGAEYWVDLKENVSQGDKEASERALSQIVVNNGRAVPTPDIARYRQLMVLASVAAWNFDDELPNGTSKVWDINLMNVKRLPGTVFDTLWTEVDELNSQPSPEERRGFPVESAGSDSVGGIGTGEPGVLPDGEGDIPAAGADAGGVPQAPVEGS